jgi:hypothetical protein
MAKKNQSKVNTSSTSHREFQRRKDKTENKGPRNKNQKRSIKINKTLKPYEHQCQSHTCSGTIVAKTIKAIAYSLCSIRPESSHAINFLK